MKEIWNNLRNFEAEKGLKFRETSKLTKKTVFFIRKTCGRPYDELIGYFGVSKCSLWDISFTGSVLRVPQHTMIGPQESWWSLCQGIGGFSMALGGFSQVSRSLNFAFGPFTGLMAPSIHSQRPSFWCTMVQNNLILGHQNSYFPISFGVRNWVSQWTIQCSRVRERCEAMWANERTDKWVAQCLRPSSWLIWTIVWC